MELIVRGSQSLKGKRGVVRSIVRRTRNRFNLSVTEVGGQDTWQRCVLGLSTIGADAVTVRKALDRAVEFIEQLHLAEVRSSDIELVELPYDEAYSAPDDDDDPLPWGESDPDFS